MSGTFYIVGVGPGDPQLMTIKSAKILDKCETWFVPTASANGASMALQIASGSVATQGKTIINHHFPMKLVHREKATNPEVQKSWEEAARIIIDYISKGHDVVFPTLGDPSIYSTSFYVCETLHRCGFNSTIEIVPGVSAIGATSAAGRLPLCLGDERLVVIPAIFENDRIRELLDLCDVAVLMKVHKVLPKIIALLEELDLIDNAVLVEQCSLAEEKVWTNIRDAVDCKLHYFSTLVVRKTLVPKDSDAIV